MIRPSALQQKTSFALGAALLAAGLLVPAPQARAGDGSRTTQASDERVAGPVEPALDGERGALIELAFRTASRFPDGNQVRNRAAAQERVVLTCLDLDRPLRAFELAGRIDGWRRGSAYAACAESFARQGLAQQAERAIALAEEVTRWSDDELKQAWRRDRIRAGIARALTWLGQHERAAAFERDSVDSEAGKAQAVAARFVEPEGFDATVGALQAVLQVGSLDRSLNALEACSALHERFYDDQQRRAIVLETVRAALPRLPLQVGVELELGLADQAVEHGDRAAALALIEGAQQRFDSRAWSLEAFVPLAARIARARAHAGEPERARRDADAALARFHAHKAELPDVFRAEALVPLAEAYHALGDTPKSLEVYALAVTEGSSNPNARPRAEDLTLICCSLAREGVAPDEALWKRMNVVYAGLDAPW